MDYLGHLQRLGVLSEDTDPESYLQAIRDEQTADLDSDPIVQAAAALERSARAEQQPPDEEIP